MENIKNKKEGIEDRTHALRGVSELVKPLRHPWNIQNFMHNMTIIVNLGDAVAPAGPH
jgi:hypothetical protein